MVLEHPFMGLPSDGCPGQGVRKPSYDLPHTIDILRLQEGVATGIEAVDDLDHQWV